MLDELDQECARVTGEEEIHSEQRTDNRLKPVKGTRLVNMCTCMYRART